MHNLNRIKVVLVEQKRTGKWLAEACTVSKWCSSIGAVDRLLSLYELLKVNVKSLLNNRARRLILWRA